MVNFEYFDDPAKQIMIEESYGGDFDRLIEILAKTLCETSKSIVRYVHIENLTFVEVANRLNMSESEIELLYKQSTVLMWLANCDLLIDLAYIFKIYPELV